MGGSDVQHLIIHFISRDLVQQKQESSGNLMRRPAYRNEDTGVAISCFEVLLRKPLEIDSIVRQDCQLPPGGECQLLCVIGTQMACIPRGKGDIPPTLEQLANKRAHILIEIEADEKPAQSSFTRESTRLSATLFRSM